MEAAEQNRAAARAEFFPDVTINGLLGVQSVELSSLLEYGSRVPAVSAAIHLPLFDAGRLKARYGAAQSSIDSAVASYQETVVSAARDVATQASTLAQIAAQRTQRSDRTRCGARSSEQARRRAYARAWPIRGRN